MDFAAEEQEGAEEEEEEDGACEVGVVHYVLRHWRQGVEHCECLVGKEGSVSLVFNGILSLPQHAAVLLSQAIGLEREECACTVPFSHTHTRYM